MSARDRANAYDVERSFRYTRRYDKAIADPERSIVGPAVLVLASIVAALLFAGVIR